MQLTNKTDEELVDQILSDLATYGDGADVIRQYLLDEIDAKQVRIYTLYRKHRNGIMEMEKGYDENPRQQELVHKLLRLLASKNYIVFNLMSTCDRRYYYYKQAQLPKEIAQQDVKSTTLNIYRMPIGDIESKEKQLNCIFSAVERDDPELLVWIKNGMHSSDADRRHISVLYAIYSKDTAVLERDLPIYLEKTLQGDDYHLRYSLYYFILLKVHGISETLNQQICAHLHKVVLRLTSTVFSNFTNNNARFLDLLKLYNTPMETQIIAKLQQLLISQESSITLPHEQIQALAKTDEFAQTLTFLTEREHLSAVIAASAMLAQNIPLPKMEGKLKKLYCDNWTEALSALLIKHCERIYCAAQDLFMWKDEAQRGNFNILTHPDFDLNDLVYDDSSNNQHWQQRNKLWYLGIACCYAAGHLTTAKNILLMLLHHSTGYFYQRISLFTRCSALYPQQPNGCALLYEWDVPFMILSKSAIYTLQTNQEKQDFLAFMLEHKQLAEQVMSDDTLTDYELITYVHMLYDNDCGFDDICLANCLQLKGKRVHTAVEALLKPRENTTRDVIVTLSKAKSKATADTALRLLQWWDNDKHEQAMRKLQSIEELTAYIEPLFTARHKKAICFEKQVAYNNIRCKDSEQIMPEVVIKYYIAEYMQLKELYRVKACEYIAKWLNVVDLRAFLKDLYHVWLSEGAASVKYRNLLLPISLTGGATQFDMLRKQIGEWADNAKPGLAEWAIKCLALNGTQTALLQVDMMGRKHKNKRVKKAAVAALEFAREALEMNKDDFEDMLVPTLEFDKNRKRSFNYGEREFIAKLGTDLSITLYDGDKIIRSLPKASEKYHDNEEAVILAKEEFKAVKKQIKIVLDAQMLRLERALYTARQWTAKRWQELFADNPLMFAFASGLIWEERNAQGELLGTFRYMEDGSLTTAEEDEYTLQPESVILLLHPTDISQQECSAWIQQLEDYEITQPIEQLTLSVWKPDESISADTAIQVYGGTIKSIGTKLGGDLLFGDYGNCQGFQCSFPAHHMRMCVTAKDGFYPGDFNTIVTIDSIAFYRDAENQQMKLEEVPPRLLSLAQKAYEMLKVKNIAQAAPQEGK